MRSINRWYFYSISKVQLLLIAASIPLGANVAGGNPIPLPQATGYLRAMVNVNQAMPYYANLWGREVMMTDMAYNRTFTSPLRDYTDARAWLKNRYPAVQVGVYCSSRAVLPANQQKRSPPNALDSALFSESDLLPVLFVDELGRRIVDYRRPATRDKLVVLLVNHAQQHQPQWLFADNWSHPSSWGALPFTWQETIAYMQQLRAALAARGIGLVCNVAMDLSMVPLADLTALGSSCDAVTLENWAVPAAINNPQRLARLVQGYQTLLVTGCRAILIPITPTLDKLPGEARFAAGLAMILDGPWVGYSFWLPHQDWFWWPPSFGRPAGPIVQNGTRLSRQFAYGRTIVIEGQTRTVSIQKSASRALPLLGGSMVIRP